MVPNIRAPLRKYARHFLELREAKANEAETVARLRQFFAEVLGYDAIKDISGETEMKGKYVDLCLKIDGAIEVLIEAKAAAVQLRVRQIDQAQHYAAENGFHWVLLTNGVEWNLYHVSFDESDGIEYDPAFEISLADEKLDEAVEKLALIHKRSISRGGLERHWERMSALCAGSIAKSLFQESVLKVLRRSIRKQCGVLIDPEDLARAVHDLFSQEARDEMGPLRIRKPKKPGSKKTVKAPPIAAAKTSPAKSKAPTA